MAIDQKRRQRKLMKKRRKDKARKKRQGASVPYTLLSVRRKILTSRELPICECLINPSWKEDGFATILLSRRQYDGSIVYGVYLVDILCLGLKNTFCDADTPQAMYERKIRSSINPKEELVECSIGLAHHIIYGAIEFAAQFGFAPQEDFELSQYVLEDINSIEPCEDIEFGKDGKPFYVSGPYDDVEYITRELRSKAGDGNFDFAIGFDDAAFDEEA